MYLRFHISCCCISVLHSRVLKQLWCHVISLCWFSVGLLPSQLPTWNVLHHPTISFSFSKFILRFFLPLRFTDLRVALFAQLDCMLLYSFTSAYTWILSYLPRRSTSLHSPSSHAFLALYVILLDWLFIFPNYFLPSSVLSWFLFFFSSIFVVIVSVIQGFFIGLFSWHIVCLAAVPYCYSEIVSWVFDL